MEPFKCVRATQPRVRVHLTTPEYKKRNKYKNSLWHSMPATRDLGSATSGGLSVPQRRAASVERLPAGLALPLPLPLPKAEFSIAADVQFHVK